MQKRCRDIEAKHVKSIEYTIPNGVTEPMMCVLEDDIRAVVKAYNNIQGNLALVNEYICYRLAEILKLPMPASGICICDASTVNENNIIHAQNLGYGFYSKYLPKNAILKPGIMKHIVNIDVFYKLVIFDHVVYNKDRNQGNLLVEYKKKNIYVSVIDHSHVFKNETIWNAECFRIGMEEKDFNDTSIMEHNDYLYEMFYRTISVTLEKLLISAREIQKLITVDVLNIVISEVPGEWIVSESDMNALKEYLLYRLEHVDDMCKVIIDYIKA